METKPATVKKELPTISELYANIDLQKKQSHKIALKPLFFIARVNCWAF